MAAVSPGRPGAERRYHRCAGVDALTTGRNSKCPRAMIDAEIIKQAVWDLPRPESSSLAQRTPCRQTPRWEPNARTGPVRICVRGAQ
jgi:hypothetical protein